MSLTNNLGQNITLATNILQKTYENLNLLFIEMDRVGEEEGFMSLTPKFLRWKSESNTNGWLTSNFIKLYQLQENSSVPHISDLRTGDIYCVEVSLNNGSEDYPEITLARFTYDYDFWTKMPSVSDHWIFFYPFRDENNFKIQEKNGIWTSTPYEKSRKKYWGIQQGLAQVIPLLQITSPETIRSEIFKVLSELPESDPTV
ncbi:hypothetical protein I6G77_28095 (plasmid) [Bacillus tropicus]|uniref:Uncharacterized protein n=1 Tax=Bacillus tropicus TaxID=2026188 RepID=A0A7T2QL50_9BACI|nr:hypothetical protein [Bacillus tropicus]AJG91221.1 hypothetical protein BG03_5713 [Bacillus cereus]QPR80667.1 hypothetical protein I6G77_28095 [Bacillus tropicus]